MLFEGMEKTISKLKDQNSQLKMLLESITGQEMGQKDVNSFNRFLANCFSNMDEEPVQTREPASVSSTQLIQSFKHKKPKNLEQISAPVNSSTLHKPAQDLNLRMIIDFERELKAKKNAKEYFKEVVDLLKSTNDNRINIACRGVCRCNKPQFFPLTLKLVRLLFEFDPSIDITEKNKSENMSAYEYALKNNNNEVLQYFDHKVAKKVEVNPAIESGSIFSNFFNT